MLARRGCAPRFTRYPIANVNTNGRKGILGIIAATLLLILVSVADYLSGPTLSFALFYFLVVALVAWVTQNLPIAVAMALVCGLTWLLAEWSTLGAPAPQVLLWNAGTRLVTLITIGILISRLRRALEQEQGYSRTDFLTGVLNARAFAAIVAAEITRARRFAHPLTLAYVDVDDFKAINDRFGHAGGDRVLRIIAQTLQSSIRETDRVARIGGDEFVLLLPETNRGAAEAALEKVREDVGEVMVRNAWPITLSIGAAACEVPPEDADQLIRAADAAMYETKAMGKNRVRVVDAPLLRTKIDTGRSVSVHL